MYQRSSGLLLHITSLPGPHGVGDLGDSAFAFVDILAAAGQHLWQVLPLGPAGAGNSPYDSRSSFAGNPLLISMTGLVADGLLDESDVPEETGFSSERVEFARVTDWKTRRLRRAFQRFQTGTGAHLQGEYETFVHRASDWLEDYALYQALRSEHDNEPWYEWPKPLRLRRAEAIAAARSRLSHEVAYHRFVQFLFDRQWHSLKEYAGHNGVRIMGDVPIYVALDSAEVWANQSQFKLDERGQPSVRAGVPPDLFAKDGQLWGNPIYDWEAMSRNDYGWWQQRIDRTFALTDIVRIDHFRGFAAGWQVPASATTARNGEWVTGPGEQFFRKMEHALGRLPIVVEDLGVITPDVEDLRDRLGYPGMKVLQFAFDGNTDNPYLPHNAVPNSMVYTGTHDNDTTVSWFESLSAPDQDLVRRYARASRDSIHWDLLRLAWSSVSVLACAPVQDVLGLGSEARMNIPGQARGNWAWRLTDFEGLRRRQAQLRDLTELYGRNRPPISPDAEGGGGAP